MPGMMPDAGLAEHLGWMLGKHSLVPFRRTVAQGLAATLELQPHGPWVRWEQAGCWLPLGLMRYHGKPVDVRLVGPEDWESMGSCQASMDDLSLHWRS